MTNKQKKSGEETGGIDLKGLGSFVSDGFFLSLREN